jgi:hypothetical protein
MDTRLNRVIETYTSQLKQSIRDIVLKLDFNEKEKANKLLNHVFNFERLTLSKEDVTKRKRVKNSIPLENRCHALRSNGEQCTRKQKDDNSFCGTHAKGTPHGLVNMETKDTDTVLVDVFAHNIQGIIYYLDKNFNVYKTEDVLSNKLNARIVSHYKIINDEYVLVPLI